MMNSYAMRAYGSYDESEVRRCVPPKYDSLLFAAAHDLSPCFESSFDCTAKHHYYQPTYPVTKIEDRTSWDLITRLMDAASTNQIKAVSDLIRNGYVSPDAQDVKHNTALLYASINGHMNVVRKLIELGVNVNYIHPYTQNTALHLAAQCGHTRTVELLLKSGQANPCLTNRDGKTSYQLAKEFGHGNNKVMKRLFYEFGIISAGNRRKNSDGEDSDDQSDRASEVDRDLMADEAAKCSSHCDDKDHSLLPNIELLSVFARTGIYRPLCGKGFAFLSPHSDSPRIMLNYARIALQLETWHELKEALLQIQSEFEEDQLLVNQVEYRRVMNADVGKSYEKKSSNSKRSKRSSESRDSQTATFDPEQELQAYQSWKQYNMSKIQELIDEVDQYVQLE